MAASFSLPTVLANLAAGNQPLSLIDGDFTACYNPLVSLNTYGNYYADTGAANAYVITVSSPQTVSQTAGLTVQFLAAHANTGASTLQINALAAKNITTPSAAALSTGMIQAGAIVTVTYDGTQYQLNAVAFGSQTANTVFAGPTSGAAAAPAFRALIAADGAAWVLLATGTASNSATVDITTGITSTYDEYVVLCTGVIPATDGSALLLRVSQDAGGTFKAGAGDYVWSYFGFTDTATTLGTGASDTDIQLSAALSNVSTQGYNGTLYFFSPSSTALHKRFVATSVSGAQAGAINTVLTAGGVFKLNTTAINAIRFLMSAGNITSGTFRLFGVRKT